jgi:hypothetical protein
MVAKKTPRGSAELRGKAYRETFFKLIEHLATNGTSSGGPMVQLNSRILLSYMHHAGEDDATKTGMAYCDGEGDEEVRAHAAREYGLAVDLSQIVALHRFMESLFLNGVAVNDVIRVRRMFFGRLAGEYIPEEGTGRA